MAKIEIRFSYTCAKNIFHGKGKDEKERKNKLHMDDKERTDTCDMQEITWDNMAYHRTRHKACTKVALGVTM